MIRRHRVARHADATRLSPGEADAADAAVMTEEKLATYGTEVRLKEAEGYTPFDRVALRAEFHATLGTAAAAADAGYPDNDDSKRRA